MPLRVDVQEIDLSHIVLLSDLPQREALDPRFSNVGRECFLQMLGDVLLVQRTKLVEPFGKVGNVPLRLFRYVVEARASMPVADGDVLEDEAVLV